MNDDWRVQVDFDESPMVKTVISSLAIVGMATVGLVALVYLTAEDAKGNGVCPSPSVLERPQNLRGAIRPAKQALGEPSRVLELKRGPRSPYAVQARSACGGVAVLRKSVYVDVHPVGMRCAACDLHAFVVKYRNGPWKIWTAY